ncbi:MAG TPA: Dam family site-specific DNA-(adenine-N6)-methyltransferase [Vicinamibacterales bacterium]|nr:Dam family site-specific DNA-(adenine-N6)-methyltransferase [Vicinamibacterales bacterium]
MRRSDIGPLLKWVGGKRQLLPQIRRFYPRSFRRYVEPFLGSGAVFFDLHASGRLAGRDAILIDSNADLIGCYQMLRDETDAVAAALERLADGHAAGGRTHYFAVRDDRFNRLRDERRGGDGRIAYTPELAAMLIYLNRTGFNGLFRLNKRGAFNVPPGRYDRPNIADHARLARVAHALQSTAVRLVCGGFERTLEFAADGDFVYFDPPYAPVSRTANFTSYTSPRFDAADQRRLQQIVLDLARRGCFVLVSNSTAAEIGALYEKSGDARAAGLHAFRVAARRAVNSVASRRGPVEEFLITNIQAPATQTN